MRRILIEPARRRVAAKRGAGATMVDVDEIEIPSRAAEDDPLLAVNEALEKFAALDPRKAELVKLSYFVGMSFEEAATALGIAVPTGIDAMRKTIREKEPVRPRKKSEPPHVGCHD